MIRAFFIASFVFLSGCQAEPGPGIEPTIVFTELPPAGDGSAAILHPIAGRVTGARPGQAIVLFARSGVWWVQPMEVDPYTPIQKDFTWKTTTHPGNAYAAVLVDRTYRPAGTLNELPLKGNAVHAVAIADFSMLRRDAVKTLKFSGYEWQVRQTANDPGGTRNFYDPSNAWTDTQGFLHLKVARKGDEWTSAEVKLTASLGYGSYRFKVRDISTLDPAAVLSMSTWDDSGPREMLVEISRWGEAEAKNAQYVIQPYYVPANVVRFMAPGGVLNYSFQWEPGRIHFRTSQNASTDGKRHVIHEHVFTSGVPTVGSETIHMNMYVFDNRRNPLRRECEVVVEEFEYLP